VVTRYHNQEQRHADGIVRLQVLLRWDFGATEEMYVTYGE